MHATLRSVADIDDTILTSVLSTPLTIRSNDRSYVQYTYLHCLRIPPLGRHSQYVLQIDCEVNLTYISLSPRISQPIHWMLPVSESCAL